jgi:hypothetical protein
VQCNPIALFWRLLWETQFQINPHNIAALREKSVQDSSALPPERELRAIGQPGEQAK